MKREAELALRVKSLVLEGMEELVKDGGATGDKEWKKVAEVYSRCICDLVTVIADEQSDPERILKGTVAKAKIGYNMIGRKQTEYTK
ncbi:hypothetical protein RKD55_002655 [Rossellomorea marisflavi]